MHVVMRPFARVFILLATLAACGEAFAGTIVVRQLESRTLGRSWSYSVYLPTGYEGSTSRYPVLWLLHGNGHTHTSWAASGRIQATADGLIASGEIPATIIVMPDAGTTWYVDRKEPMETAVVRELIPHVDAVFRTIAARNGRLVAGLSMGGYGTMRLAMKYPELFAAAALLSPAVYDDPPANSAARRVGVFGSPDYDPAVWKALSHRALWSAYQARQMPVPMYVVSGDDDEYLIESSATAFYELLRAHKHPAELRIVDGAHTWAVWSTTIGDAMKYMFRYTARPAR
jgi:enterochelin esterase-like enzyme